MRENTQKRRGPLYRKIQKNLRQTSIFQRLNRSFLLLISLAVGFIIFFCFYRYSGMLQDEIRQNVSWMVQTSAWKGKDVVREYEALAVAFYDDTKLIRALEENSALQKSQESEAFKENRTYIEERLYKVRSAGKHIVNMQLITPYGQYYMNEKGYRRGGCIRDLEDFYESDFYQLPQQKKGYPIWIDSLEQSKFFFKSEQYIYGIGNTVSLCVGVYTPIEKKFLGVLVMNIDLDAFHQIWTGTDAKRDGNAFLVGEDGVLLSFSANLKAPAFPGKDSGYEEMLQQGKGLKRLTMKHDQRILMAYERIPSTGLVVTYLIDEGMVFRSVYQIRNLCLLVLIGMVAACFLISRVVTESIVDPVDHMIEVMKKIGDGDFLQRYENEGKDEIAILGSGFNEMADKIQQLIQQVYLSEIRRQKLSLSWKNAQLDAFLMQINPHFLYNTLDIIRWEAMYEAGGESRVTHMIEAFSRLCRMGMRLGTNTVTLQVGIDHAKTYLEVINFRHQHKIQMEMELSLDPEQYYIPQFLLQPLLENAIIHAFGDASKGSRLFLSCKEKEECLYITLRDNGKGMTEEECRKLNELLDAPVMELENTGSIGMKNVNQRIRLFYGEEYGLHVYSHSEEGSEVQIMLPIRKESEDMRLETEEDAGDVSGFDRR